jgi:hypothetical protein
MSDSWKYGPTYVHMFDDIARKAFAPFAFKKLANLLRL